jgi:hypothetical protein
MEHLERRANSDQENAYTIMLKKWGERPVPRSGVAEFSFGSYSPKTIANADSAGVGPEGKFKLNGRVYYWPKPFVAWMRERA